MDEQEKDPAQCRQLRQHDRDTQDDMRLVVSQHRQLEPELASISAELDRLYARRENFYRAKISADAASLVPRVGAAAGLVGVGLDQNIALVETEIASAQRKQDAVERDMQRLTWQARGTYAVPS